MSVSISPDSGILLPEGFDYFNAYKNKIKLKRKIWREKDVIYAFMEAEGIPFGLCVRVKDEQQEKDALKMIVAHLKNSAKLVKAFGKPPRKTKAADYAKWYTDKIQNKETHVKNIALPEWDEE